ncbi:MAG: RlmI/RlmK family 23S rRNA methyltransferase, partial [Pseudomonadota bacterium]
MSETRPTIRLRPKGGARLRTGAPWAYADELVLDRRSRNVPAGSVVTLEDAERRPIATGAFNPHSKIAFRLLSRDPEAMVTKEWLRKRLSRALKLRERLYDAPFYRLIHAEADGLPGVVIDRFGEACAIQPNAAWADVMLDALAEAVAEVTG